MNLGGYVDESVRCERLLNGLKANPKYQLEANLMELLPNQTWDTITNNLRQYDRSDTILKKETANAAMNIVCHSCHAPGHKSPDCPHRNKGGKGYGRGRGGGKSGGKGFSGGRGGKSYGGKYGGGRGNGQKGGKGKPSYNTSHSRACNLCNKTGHFSSNCPHAKEFAKMLAKRENRNPEGYLPKRRKEYEDDGNNSEYSMMFSEVRGGRSFDTAYAYNVHLAALDSGCSSHAIMESSLPVGAVIDKSRTTHIQTASADTTIFSHGRSTNGLIRNALVVKDDKLSKNLVSIAMLDRLGYTITFRGCWYRF
jgi:hypothetical protein